MKKLIYIIFSVILFVACGSDPSIGTEQYIIVVDVEGLGKVRGANAYGLDDVCTLIATPDTLRGYKFDYWLELPDNLYINNESVYSFSVDETRHIKAVFSKK